MRLRFSALLLLLGSATATVHAQAVPAATIPGDIQIGAGYVNANPDYGPDRMNGVFVFADADLWKNFGAEASYHRISGGNQTTITENTYEVGARYRYRIRKFSPYLKIMIGAGNFAFGTSTQDGTYRIYAGGGGVDYRVTTHFVARADYEYQRWGTFPPRGLQPNLFSLGLAFRFH